MDFLSKNNLERYGHEWQLWLFIALFVLLWNVEALAGVLLLRERWKRVLVNAPFAVSNIPGQLIMGGLFIVVIQWITVQKIGIVYWLHIENHSLLTFLVTFLFLDFGEYIYHVIMHKTRMLWVFHAVHHSDDHVDISTTLREHPGENFIRQSFTLVWVFLSGTLFWALMLRQIIQAVTTLIAHVGWQLPDRIDRVLGWVFITPNLHQVHHHYKQPYTDSNYGDVLSIWDRIFGTFQRMPARDILFGVDTLQHTKTNTFSALIRMPFSVTAGTSQAESNE